MDLKIFIYIPIVFLLLLLPTRSEKVQYKGFKVLRLHIATTNDLKTLDSLKADSSLGLDFWTEPLFNTSVDVCVPPLSLNSFLSALISAGIRYNTQINDIQSLIDKEDEASEIWRAHRRLRRSTFDLDPGSGADDPVIDPALSPGALDPELFYWYNVVGQYVSTEEIYEWMRFATYTKPDLVSVEVVGHSYEKRPIKLAKIGVPRKDGRPKPVIWIDSGIHAREWVTVATVTYIIYQLVDGYGKYTEVTRMLDTYDWYLLPVHNPDGYEYSRDHNRMWRKNRAPTFDYKCIGVDLNRNYGFMWQKCTDAPDAKHCIETEKPCNAVYGGPKPFSEPETQAVSQFILKHKAQIRMFFSLHAYSQLWLLPWGYTKKRPRDIKELNRVARAGCAALENIYGTKYAVGSPARILYRAGGSSLDWAKGVVGIPYVYLLELRDRGEYGFMLPARDILPSAEETWQGIVAAADTIVTTL